MFRNILLPLDGSHFSALALPLAVRVAKAARARLHIVRVHVPEVALSDNATASEFDDLVRQKEREQLQGAAETARASGVDASYELLEGPIASGLQRYAAARFIDLVVMTTHARSGLQRAVFGSVADECIRLLRVPMLLLHEPTGRDEACAQLDGFHRIVVPLDGSPESERVLQPALQLAQLMDARLTLTRVATTPFEIAVTIGPEAMRDYLKRAHAQASQYLEQVAGGLATKVRVDTVAVVADRASDGILRCREEVGADAIAMATHGRTGWSRIAVGSIAAAVLQRAPVPVLILRP